MRRRNTGKENLARHTVRLGTLRTQAFYEAYHTAVFDIIDELVRETLRDPEMRAEIERSTRTLLTMMAKKIGNRQT